MGSSITTIIKTNLWVPETECTPLYKNADTTADFKIPDDAMILDRALGVFFLCSITIFYLPILYIIYIWRNKQAVSFKSPKLIIIGGMGLLGDSWVNIAINTDWYGGKYENKVEFICVMSIFTTLIFHYTGYICLILRGFRIFKVMKLERNYLDTIY